MKDFHPVVAAWRFIQPLLFGQIHTNKRAISAHYDIDPEFFLSFLDPETPCYTQGSMKTQTKHSVPRRCGNLNIALKGSSLKRVIVFSRLVRVGERGLNTHRSEASIAPGSAIRRSQSTI